MKGQWVRIKRVSMATYWLNEGHTLDPVKDRPKINELLNSPRTSVCHTYEVVSEETGKPLNEEPERKNV